MRVWYDENRTKQKKKNKNWSEVKREEALKESCKIWGNVQGRPFWKSTRSLLMTWDHHHYHHWHCRRWNTKAVNAAIASVRAAVKPYFKLSCLASIFLTVSSLDAESAGPNFASPTGILCGPSPTCKSNKDAKARMLLQSYFLHHKTYAEAQNPW